MSAKHRFSPNRWALNHKLTFAFACAVVLYLSAVFLGSVIANNGTYPGGVDTLCHLYKGDVLYKSVQNGVMWPLYDPLWYNGVQMMRYWAPLPVYVLAGCESLAGGDPLGGFVVFSCLVFIVGAISWIAVGMLLRRPWLGLALGILWFFLPNNLMALFHEGNLPRCLCLAVLPLFLYLIYRYLRKKGSARIILALTALFAFMALCHSGFAGMILISVLIYLVCYGIACRSWARGLAVLTSLAAGYLAIGVWLVPSLIGGITSASSDQIMAGFFQSLATTLNPFERFSSNNTKFYFGAAAAVVVLLGLLGAKRAEKSGFLAAGIIVLLTSESAYPIVSVLPGGQYLWMLRFISIALAFTLFSLACWRTLKTPIVLALCLLLAIDCVPSASLVYGNQDGSSPYERLAADEELTLVAEAKKITTQRLALVDESRLDSESAYLVTGLDEPLAMSEGAAWQSSVTASNFMQLDRALEEGEFDYLFDRSLELGDDSVITATSLVKQRDASTEEKLDAAASRSGFKLVSVSGDYRLYHRNAPTTFGVKSSYRAIAIGTSAPGLTLQFPAFEEADSTNLSDYSFEDLEGYDVIFLGGFTFNDREKAEELVEKLANNGTRIVIAADGIPADEHTGSKTFLGLDCEEITFKNGFPELQTEKGSMVTTLFPNGFEQWDCVYVNGIDNPSAVIEEGERTLPVCGSLANPNIQVIGLNLTYYESLTHDDNVASLLSNVLGVSSSELPKRELVAMNVSISGDSSTIVIDSPVNDVDTTLAYQDIFEGNRPLAKRNNLLHVDKGKTVITMTYPYLPQGLLVSIGGVALSIVLYRILRRREKNELGEW